MIVQLMSEPDKMRVAGEARPAGDVHGGGVGGHQVGCPTRSAGGRCAGRYFGGPIPWVVKAVSRCLVGECDFFCNIATVLSKSDSSVWSTKADNGV